MMNSIAVVRARGVLAFFIALALVASLAWAGSSGATQVETIRTSYLGPEEGETLTSWTERWLDGPVQHIATEEEIRIYRSL